MKRAFMKGNDAVICGALAAGCRAFFGYPITPASEIAHDAMRAFPESRAAAIQAESEVAAINMLYGAGACGEAAMTATSGPGFSLMQEGLSYMAAARIPGVVVDIMRAGPGLGNIGPEQGDYFMATRGGGHGHYKMPVFAPDSVTEMFTMTRDAFDAAFKFRTPVCVLADAFIGQMMETIDIPEELPPAGSTAAERMPFEDAATGEPGTMGHVVSSLELVPARLEEKNDIRFAAYAEMADKLPDAEIDDDDPGSDKEIVIVAFGICARIAREAMIRARQKGRCVSLFRPKTLWPFPEKLLTDHAGRARKILVIECNRGMMREDVERILGRERVISINRDGGMLPAVDDIEQRLEG